MTNIFIELPDSLLRFTLLPLLDYYDRIALNACLPAACRIGKKIRNEAIIIADLRNAVKNLKKDILIIQKLELGSIALANAVYNYLSSLIPVNLVVVKYNPDFRRTLFERLDYFSNPVAFENTCCSAEFQNRMFAVCTNLRALIERKHPYVRHIKVPFLNTYSYVDKLPLIVEGQKQQQQQQI